MPVNTARSDYNTFLEYWQRVRDCFNGRDAVIAAGAKYVPDLKGLDPDGNKNYRNRGNFYNALSRTVIGLIGGIFQEAPEFDIPTPFKDYLDDITLTNVTMEMFSLESSYETMLIGRYGVLIDMERADKQAPTTNLRPYLVGFRAEDIVNWRLTRIGGDEVLTMVILRETYEETDPKDSFVTKEAVQYRVCQLDPNTRIYFQQVYRKPENQTQFIAFEEPIIPQRRGKSLSFIPFVFLGPSNASATLVKPPLLDLADVNLAHWRNSVDYEHGLHIVALPTPWVAGMTGSGELKVGPSNVWVLDPGGNAGMLEFSGAGLQSLVTAMEEKKKQMASLGARMLIDPPISNETATAVLLRHSGDYASLKTIAQSLEQGFTQCLQTIVWWMGTDDLPKDVDASCELNKEFAQVKMDPQSVQAALAVLQAGKMSFETFWELLTTGGWGREGIDAEEELGQIKKEGGDQPPQPGQPGQPPVPGQPPEVIAQGNPYKVVKRGKKWRVVKISTGQTVPGGTHGTQQEALAHFRALEANVKD